MLEPGSQLIRSSDAVELSEALDHAQGLGLFLALERVYAGFPETHCENCARCCFESPGVFFVEYLYMLDQMTESGHRLTDRLLARALRELFFSWIEPDRACIFLDSSRCIAYERRPLACRLFGIVRQAAREEAEAQARIAARQDAVRLRRFGIQVPEEVVRRSLASCDRVRDGAGRPVAVDSEAVAARVASLDAVLLPRRVVVQEFCFRSLPERIGAAALGAEAVDTMRLQLLRRAQRGEDIGRLVQMLVNRAEPLSSLGTGLGGDR